MIVVTVEMWPGGDKSKRYLLGIATITNDATGTREIGNYDATFSDQVNIVKGGAMPENLLVHAGRVENFDRQRRNVWQLLNAALGDALGKWFGKKHTPAKEQGKLF